MKYNLRVKKSSQPHDNRFFLHSKKQWRRVEVQVDKNIHGKCMKMSAPATSLWY